MAEKSALDHTIRMLRRLDDDEIDLVASLISKKLRNRSVDDLKENESILIFNFGSFISKLKSGFNPTSINADPDKEVLDLLKGSIESSGLLEGKPKQFIAIVSPRFKYEGGESAAKAWLMKVGLPEAYVNKIFYTSCMPERNTDFLVMA